MILVAGGTGRLGSVVARRLASAGHHVRTTGRAEGDLAHVTAADLDGVSVVVSCVTGFPGQSVRHVDRDGNLALVDAAAEVGADVVLVSVLGAAATAPMELFRMKHAAEEHLRRSSCRWTVVRSEAFEETWVELLERTAGRGHRPLVLGRGDNPFAWVPVGRVADEVVRAVTDPTTRGTTLEVSGPRRCTLDELARTVMADHGWEGGPRHVPRAVLHVASLAPGRPGRVARAALAMDGVAAH